MQLPFNDSFSEKRCGGTDANMPNLIILATVQGGTPVALIHSGVIRLSRLTCDLLYHSSKILRCNSKKVRCFEPKLFQATLTIFGTVLRETHQTQENQ